MEDLEDFSFNVQKLIVQTRLDLEPEFQDGKKKKSVLWGQVVAKIKETKPDFDLTKDQTIRKYLNLQTTYRRIKNRSNLKGKSAVSSWEFFDLFEEVYGKTYSIKRPLKHLQSSFHTADEADDGNSNDSLSSIDYSDASCQKKKRRISNENDTLDFLKREAVRDEERHKEIMELERRKIDMEQEKIKAMIELKNVLEKMLEK